MFRMTNERRAELLQATPIARYIELLKNSQLDALTRLRSNLTEALAKLLAEKNGLENYLMMPMHGFNNRLEMHIYLLAHLTPQQAARLHVMQHWKRSFNNDNEYNNSFLNAVDIHISGKQTNTTFDILSDVAPLYYTNAANIDDIEWRLGVVNTLINGKTNMLNHLNSAQVNNNGRTS